MESWGPGMPGPTLFLLLVLPPPPLSLGSFQHSGPGWKDLHHLSVDWGKLYRHLIQNSGSFQHRQGPGTWHRKSRSREDRNSCHSSFDLYFILDMSGSVNNNWMNIYSFVEDLVKKFENPNLRMSFITFSTEGHTVMQLTSDRNEVHDGLIRLQNIVPTGDTYMQEGFKKAIEQIEQAHSGENKVHSMIICLTDGTLEEKTLKETVKEADKARQMGATVYCVGVKNFEEHQLIEIADSPYHVFAVNQGFKALKDIVDPLETKSCIEITSVEPSDICVGDEYELMISGKGFNNAKNEDEVICRFKFKDKLIDEKANSVQDTSMICPGIKIENPDEAFSLEISLNNGISFINSDVSLTSKDCAIIPYINPLYFFALIPALLLLSLMFCCIWWLCHRRTLKEPPPVLNPERVSDVFGPDVESTPIAHNALHREAPDEPEETCQMPCPTVIVPCGCQGGGMKRMEGKLDSLCDFVQRCNQMSVMWCPTRDMVEQEGVSVKGSPHFNPDPDAETLYKAMKGIGTNEQAIIDVLTKRSNAQRQQIAKSFKAQFGKDLIETLKSELSGKFERLIIALMYPPYRYEAKELYDAMKGIGTKEGVIIEILASRTKNQLQEIMKAYEEDYGSNLEEDIKADTSGYLERILVCLLQGSRDDLSGYVDPGLALQDAQDLYAAGEKICGTDEMKFITILCTRSATHLMRVFEEYEKIANKSIEDSIKSETHGSLEEAMLTVVKCTRNLHGYFAERLYFAMKGAGTLDGTLIRNIVSRSEIDLNLIKNQFKKMYGKTLSSMIMEDTSGDYKNALLNLVGSDL
ncbi:hypothetical protein E5288_WYG016399 [Bos mutus]|uniref:Annexin n=1 Tax=Bos mutus TaxID=72004 RepID=A0A6B0REA8_9CETA|nr:hypothetical protein [Bos mutus]